MRLKDKVCVITGAASGIGKATALLFAKEGAKVIACDVQGENLKVLKEEAKPNDNVFTYVLDVTDRSKIKEVVENVVKRFEKIDVLINNAGITRDALLIKMSEEDWNKVIEVNLKGIFNMTQAIIPYMLSQNSGSIVNASSVVAIYGNIGQTNYVASKAGVIGMTKVWAKEFARKGAQIRVNAVAPGFIKTPMTAKVPQKIIQSMLEKIPLKRMGEAEEVARVYLFLASDESSYVTGQVIGVDGGLVI